MRRLMLLIAVGGLWLFLAALPVFADGGPHVAAINSGVSSLTADSCAGCHRAHTASGPLLLNEPTEEELCLNCHGAASTGATTDVMTGVQYAIAPSGLRDATAELGALRGGGFDEARIGDPFRYMVGSSRLAKVQVATTDGINTTSAPVTSAHLEMVENGLDQPGIAWGNGANGSGVGAAVSLSCASCHNPHGNGMYRILNPVPISTTFNAWVAQVVDYGVAGAAVYRTAASHSFMIGDRVVVAGNSLVGINTAATGLTVATVPSNTTFTLTGVVVPGTGTGGTAARIGGATVTDAAPPPDGDARNYTVIQTQGTGSLLASQVAAFDPVDGDYFHYRIPWNGTSGTTLDAPNGIPGPVVGARGFGQEITAWCSSCHTRYMAYSEPLTNPADGTTGAAYNTARPGDDIFTYQHRTRGASGRGCLTCHVTHGSNAVMDGTFSSTFTFPNGTASDNSRLLKVDNRGTCQLCHDPTGTTTAGSQFPPAPYPIPSVP